MLRALRWVIIRTAWAKLIADPSGLWVPARDRANRFWKSCKRVSSEDGGNVRWLMRNIRQTFSGLLRVAFAVNARLRRPYFKKHRHRPRLRRPDVHAFFWNSRSRFASPPVLKLQIVFANSIFSRAVSRGSVHAETRVSEAAISGTAASAARNERG